MWRSEITALADTSGDYIRLWADKTLMTNRDVLTGLVWDAQFRRFFNEVLVGVRFRACFWETPSICLQNLDRPYGCVVLDAPVLEVEPQPRVFAGYFEGVAPETEVLSIPNLGGNALLIVPRQVSAAEHYVHLARFVRMAPARQAEALWELMARTALCLLEQEPLWISTHGVGVSWLHVRLERTPKYYSHGPFRRPD